MRAASAWAAVGVHRLARCNGHRHTRDDIIQARAGAHADLHVGERCARLSDVAPAKTDPGVVHLQRFVDGTLNRVRHRRHSANNGRSPIQGNAGCRACCFETQRVHRLHEHLVRLVLLHLEAGHPCAGDTGNVWRTGAVSRRLRRRSRYLGPAGQRSGGGPIVKHAPRGDEVVVNLAFLVLELPARTQRPRCGGVLEVRVDINAVCRHADERGRGRVDGPAVGVEFGLEANTVGNLDPHPHELTERQRRMRGWHRA